MIHPERYYLPAVIAALFLLLSQKSSFAQSFDLKNPAVEYVTLHSDTITINWPRDDKTDSLNILLGGGKAKVYYNLNGIFTLITKDTRFSIKGHKSCRIMLEGNLQNPVKLHFFIQNKALSTTVTFIKSQVVFSDTLDFGIIKFNGWDNTIDLGASKGKDSLTILNPSSNTFYLAPPDWLKVSSQFIPPYSSSLLEFEVDVFKLIDTLNQNTDLFFNTTYFIDNKYINICKNNNLKLSTIHIVLQRDFPREEILCLMLLSTLIGGVLAFLFLKKRKKKSYNKIKQYMEENFGIFLDSTEEGILKGLAQILDISANARAKKGIEEVLSSYLSKINSLPTGKIGQIDPLDIIGTGEDARKASEIINALILLFNEKIEIHQQNWRILGSHLGYRTNDPFSPDEIKNLLEGVKVLKEKEESQLLRIKGIAKSSASRWEDAINKIEYSLASLGEITDHLKKDFQLSGDSPNALKENLRIWKKQNDLAWHKLSKIANVSGRNSDIISRLENIKNDVDDVCNTYRIEKLIYIKDYISDKENENERALNALAESLGIKNASPQSINEGINKQSALIKDIIDTLSTKAKDNAPNADFSITSYNVIERIKSMSDPNFGKPLGFPDFVHDFKNDLKRTEQELKSVLDTMRKTDDNLFTKLLERAYHTEGRQKGVKPALDMLSDDSKLKVQLGVNPNDMQYVTKSLFYNKFIKENLDTYTNDLAKLYAYSKVNQPGINMADILNNQHNIKYLSIESIYRNLSSAYQKIGITLLIPNLFEDRFDAVAHEDSPSASSFQGMYSGKYANIFDSVKNPVIYDIDVIGMKSVTLDFYKKPIVFRK